MDLNELQFDITTLHEAYVKGLAPADVIRECFRRIEAHSDPGIFIHLMDATVIQMEAVELGGFDPAARPLWGIPFVIKDNIDAAGTPTTAACPEYSYKASKDAFVVRQLKNAGALLIGKANLDQFATGLVGVRSPFPPPKNAIDPEIVPGGSSSGSAVAVAAGLATFALGTDTAGSGRVPAALNNIVGLKPTVGSLSASGVVPACRTLDTVSIFALTVDDAYQAFQIAAVHDPEDAYSTLVAASDLIDLPPAFRVGVPNKASREFFGDDIQADSYSDALEVIEELGGKVVEMDFTPFYQVAEMLYEGAWVAERYTVVSDLLKQNPDAVFPVTRQIISQAEKLSAADAFHGIYRLKSLKRQTEPLLQKVDLFCVPSIPTFYSLADLESDPVGPNSRLGTYTNFVNLLDMCGIAVPVSERKDGRPGSVTLLGTAGEDARIAALAAALHKRVGVRLGATCWSLPEPPVRRANIEASQIRPGEIAIAAVGAHMSGLPLNGELTKLGARFVRVTKTAPTYRLYNLPDGPPARPGLVRDESGSSIELEIWALPEAQIGPFLRAIPAPLGLGALSLVDGETVNGFICETAGIKGAIDITDFGGWRNYINA